MSKNLRALIAASVGLVIGTAALPAFASFGADKDKDDNKPGFTVKAIDWAEFKDRCVNPQKYPDIQVAPQHIQFQCVDAQLDWVSEQPGTIPMPGYRTIQGAIVSDKFAVNAAREEAVLTNKGGSCMRYKEVERSIKLEVPMSCNDIQKWGSPVEYCKMAADSAKGANPKLVSSRDTGRVIDSCKGLSAPNPKPIQ
jgi:hypothetical protein